ncbi:MAG: hypothetical protein HY791_24745 [Deltaproteobacteria bacterium]|nr:hypothetical protein [Deltaproteobacteria bacterium]
MATAAPPPVSRRVRDGLAAETCGAGGRPGVLPFLLCVTAGCVPQSQEVSWPDLAGLGFLIFAESNGVPVKIVPTKLDGRESISVIEDHEVYLVILRDEDAAALHPEAEFDSSATTSLMITPPPAECPNRTRAQEAQVNGPLPSSAPVYELTADGFVPRQGSLPFLDQLSVTAPLGSPRCPSRELVSFGATSDVFAGISALRGVPIGPRFDRSYFMAVTAIDDDHLLVLTRWAALTIERGGRLEDRPDRTALLAETDLSEPNWNYEQVSLLEHAPPTSAFVAIVNRLDGATGVPSGAIQTITIEDGLRMTAVTTATVALGLRITSVHADPNTGRIVALGSGEQGGFALTRSGPLARFELSPLPDADTPAFRSIERLDPELPGFLVIGDRGGQAWLADGDLRRLRPRFAPDGPRLFGLEPGLDADGRFLMSAGSNARVLKFRTNQEDWLTIHPDLPRELFGCQAMSEELCGQVSRVSTDFKRIALTDHPSAAAFVALGACTAALQVEFGGCTSTWHRPGQPIEQVSGDSGYFRLATLPNSNVVLASTRGEIYLAELP